MELPDLPEGWRLISLIDITENAPCWSAQAKATWGDYTHGTGTTQRYAMLNIIERIEDGEVYAPLSGMQTTTDFHLLDVLNIQPAQPAATERRRG
jgi:hypothetical protein